MDHQGNNNAQIDETKCQRGHSTCRNIFPITIVAVEVTFLKVILNGTKNVSTIRSNLEVSDSVLVFVREVIWHQAGGYNWNIMPQILSFLTHVTALLHFYYNFLTLQN